MWVKVSGHDNCARLDGACCDLSPFVRAEKREWFKTRLAVMSVMNKKRHDVSEIKTTIPAKAPQATTFLSCSSWSRQGSSGVLTILCDRFGSIAVV